MGARMRIDTDSRWTPAIIVSDTDQERLSRLAASVMGRIPDIAEELMAEMERAAVVADDAIPPTVVQMGSMVEFKTDDGHRRRVQLVFPSDADIALGRVSILTPIGAALIGLSEGQAIMWTTRDGRELELTVLSVEPLGVTA